MTQYVYAAQSTTPYSPPLLGCTTRRYEQQIGRILGHSSGGDYFVSWTDHEASPPQWDEKLSPWELRDLVIDPVTHQYIYKFYDSVTGMPAEHLRRHATPLSFMVSPAAMRPEPVFEEWGKAAPDQSTPEAVKVEDKKKDHSNLLGG